MKFIISDTNGGRGIAKEQGGRKNSQEEPMVQKTRSGESLNSDTKEKVQEGLERVSSQFTFRTFGNGQNKSFSPTLKSGALELTEL